MDLLTLPILIPLFSAIIAVIAWRSRLWQRICGIGGMLTLFACSILLLLRVSNDGIQAIQVGNWPAPFGITLVADLFSAVMLLAASFAGLMAAIFSAVTIDAGRERFGYYQFMHFMMFGVCGAFLTGDIFNLFVWFEVMLIASFVLMALGGERAQVEGAMKYVVLNLVSSAVFLSATGLLYGMTGTLNLADLAVKLNSGELPLQEAQLLTATSMLFLVSFGLKAGVFPLFFWLPASYHTPPVAVSAIFSALLTKVGIYSLIRYFSLVQPIADSPARPLLFVIAGFTMVVGVLGAVAQYDFRRLLSFHIVSQIGYAVMGLAFFTPLGIGAALYFLVHNIVAKTNLFLVSGITSRIQRTHCLKVMGALYKSYPTLAIAFMVSAFSLAGIPPLAGFFAKLALIRAGFESHAYLITAVALAVSLLTLYSMTKIFAEAFWKEVPEHAETPVSGPNWSPAERWGLYGPVIAMAVAAVILGLLAGPCMELALRAGEQMTNPSEYIQAVLHSRQ